MTDLEKLLKSLDELGKAVSKGQEDAKAEYIVLKDNITAQFKTSTEGTSEFREGLEKQFGELKTNHENVVKEVEYMKEQYKKGVEKDPTNLSGFENYKDKFSILKMSRAMISLDWEKEAPFEKGVLDEIKKAQNTADNTQGGFTIPRQVTNDIIELLRAKAVVLSIGASVLTGLVGSPYEQPKIKNGGTAYWVGEGAAITESELGFGMASMQPKQLAALVGMTNRWFRMSSPDGESMIRQDLVTVLALALDSALLTGTGGSNQPLGVSLSPDILTGGGGNIAPSYDNFTDLIGQLEDANSLMGKVGIISHPKVRRLLKKEKILQFSGDTGGDSHFAPIMSDAAVETAIGYPWRVTTQLGLAVGGADTAEIFLGNWNELIVGIWANLEFAVATEATVGSTSAFANNMRFIRVITEVDSMIRHGASFVYKSDVDVS
ncbi:MAG: phage major capsid protein [Candidatus Anammoxibacter sp.]